MNRLGPILVLVLALSSCEDRVSTPTGTSQDTGPVGPKEDIGPRPDTHPPVDLPQGTIADRGKVILPDKGKKCGPPGCTGCCLPSGKCLPGTGDKECGFGGAVCLDCTVGGMECQAGVCGVCKPSCTGKKCGEPDGCQGKCAGPCDGWATCDSKTKTCTCGKAPHYKWVNGVCKPSCGTLLTAKGWKNVNLGCCSKGCAGKSSIRDETWDCVFCCENSGNVCM